MPKGKHYSAEFKARVVLGALQGARTVNELAAEHDLNPNLVRNWKAKAESGLSRVFSAAEDERARERELAEHREEMNVGPACPRPNLSKPAKKAPGHPYLLKNKAVLFPNQVWGIDITYAPVGRAHMCLTCVIDRCSRLVVARRLADDMGAAGVCACVEEAFAAHGTPAILNSDQGSVFNSAAYEGLLAGNGVRQGMDGKARRAGDVIVERWFRSLKTECVRISEHETPAELRRLVAGYVEQHNNARPHQSLGYDTPTEWYYSGLMTA